jgi:hypothetical protein
LTLSRCTTSDYVDRSGRRDCSWAIAEAETCRPLSAPPAHWESAGVRGSIVNAVVRTRVAAALLASSGALTMWSNTGAVPMQGRRLTSGSLSPLRRSPSRRKWAMGAVGRRGLPSCESSSAPLRRFGPIRTIGMSPRQSRDAGQRDGESDRKNQRELLSGRGGLRVVDSVAVRCGPCGCLFRTTD